MKTFYCDIRFFDEVIAVLILHTTNPLQKYFASFVGPPIGFIAWDGLKPKQVYGNAPI